MGKGVFSHVCDYYFLPLKVKCVMLKDIASPAIIKPPSLSTQADNLSVLTVLSPPRPPSDYAWTGSFEGWSLPP